MALNFDVSAVKDYETKLDHPTEPNRWHPVLDAVLSAMMVIGIGKITDSTIEEVKERIGAYQKAFGPLMQTWTTEVYVTDADIETLKGLHTNISYVSKTKWANHFLEVVTRDASFTQKSPTIIPAFDLVEYLSIQDSDGNYVSRPSE